MARTAGSSGVKTMQAIRRAGIKRIYQIGFEAMNLRDLADDVGIQVGSLYNYIRHKEEFLFTILHEIMNELHEGLSKELVGASDPVDALERFVGFHVRWHTARKEEVFIGNMELRSLSAAHYRQIVALRKKYETLLCSLLEEGNRAKLWEVRDPKVTSYVLIASLTGVCTWYSPKGRLSQDAIIELYTEHVFKAVGLSSQALKPARRKKASQASR